METFFQNLAQKLDRESTIPVSTLIFRFSFQSNYNLLTVAVTTLPTNRIFGYYGQYDLQFVSTVAASSTTFDNQSIGWNLFRRSDTADLHVRTDMSTQIRNAVPSLCQRPVDIGRRNTASTNRYWRRPREFLEEYIGRTGTVRDSSVTHIPNVSVTAWIYDTTSDNNGNFTFAGSVRNLSSRFSDSCYTPVLTNWSWVDHDNNDQQDYEGSIASRWVLSRSSVMPV